MAEKCNTQFKKFICHSLESPEKGVSMGDCGPSGQALGIVCVQLIEVERSTLVRAAPFYGRGSELCQSEDG